jgi:hypothetical protein
LIDFDLHFEEHHQPKRREGLKETVTIVNPFRILKRLRLIEDRLEQPFVHPSGLSDYIDQLARVIDVAEPPVKKKPTKIIGG